MRIGIVGHAAVVLMLQRALEKGGHEVAGDDIVFDLARPRRLEVVERGPIPYVDYKPLRNDRPYLKRKKGRS